MRYLLGLLLLLSVTLGQVNDKNFKETINGGMVVVVVTAEWQEQDFDKDILKGVKGYQDCEIVTVKSEDTTKVVKKLRFRNFPSMLYSTMVLRKETWKADMDGELDIDNKDIKGKIDDVLEGCILMNKKTKLALEIIKDNICIHCGELTNEDLKNGSKTNG